MRHIFIAGVFFYTACLFEQDGSSGSKPEKGQASIHFGNIKGRLISRLTSGASLAVSSGDNTILFKKDSSTNLLSESAVTITSVPSGWQTFVVSTYGNNNTLEFSDTCSYLIKPGQVSQVNLSVIESGFFRFISVRDFRVTDRFNGWEEMPGSFRTFEALTLKDLINGGADQYAHQGLHNGISQSMRNLSHGTEKHYESLIMDFGIPENASRMFKEKINETDMALSVDKYPEDRVRGRSLLGGIVLFAHFDHFFFELRFSGFSSEKIPEAIAMAEDLLALHEKTCGIPDD